MNNWSLGLSNNTGPLIQSHLKKKNTTIDSVICRTSKRGFFGKVGKLKSMICVYYGGSVDGCYSGRANGKVYYWTQTRQKRTVASLQRRRRKWPTFSSYDWYSSSLASKTCSGYHNTIGIFLCANYRVCFRIAAKLEMERNYLLVTHINSQENYSFSK